MTINELTVAFACVPKAKLLSTVQILGERGLTVKKPKGVTISKLLIAAPSRNCVSLVVLIIILRFVEQNPA